MNYIHYKHNHRLKVGNLAVILPSENLEILIKSPQQELFRYATKEKIFRYYDDGAVLEIIPATVIDRTGTFIHNTTVYKVLIKLVENYYCENDIHFYSKKEC